MKNLRANVEVLSQDEIRLYIQQVMLSIHGYTEWDFSRHNIH